MLDVVNKSFMSTRRFTVLRAEVSRSYSSDYEESSGLICLPTFSCMDSDTTEELSKGPISKHVVIAEPGSLGIGFVTESSGPTVHEVLGISQMIGQIQVNDVVSSVNKIDVRDWTCDELLEFLEENKNEEKEITLLRASTGAAIEQKNVVAPSPSVLNGVEFIDTDVGPVVYSVGQTMKGKLSNGDVVVAVDDVEVISYKARVVKDLVRSKTGTERTVTVLSVTKAGRKHRNLLSSLLWLAEEDQDDSVSRSHLQKSLVLRESFAKPKEFKLKGSKYGPKVDSIKRGSKLSGEVFQGDLILAINDEPCNRTKKATELLQSSSNKKVRLCTLHMEETAYKSLRVYREVYVNSVGSIGMKKSDGRLVVCSVGANSGLQGRVFVGDEISQIDDAETENMSINEALKLLTKSKKRTKMIKLRVQERYPFSTPPSKAARKRIQGRS